MHLAPLAQEIDPGLLDTFPGSMMVITPQGWMRGWDEDGKIFPVQWEHAEAAFARADVVIFSTDDVPIPAVIARYAELAKLMVVTESRRGCLVYERQAALALARLPPGPRGRPDGRRRRLRRVVRHPVPPTGNPAPAPTSPTLPPRSSSEKRAWQGIPTPEAVADRLKRGKRRGA